MVNCFLTGVQMHFDDAFVLNRRDVRNLHDALKERLASLRRLIDQFTPLDDHDKELLAAYRSVGAAPKKHRLVCKAVAATLATGFPEVNLFVSWPDYQKGAQKTSLEGVRSHPVLSESIVGLDDNAVRQAEKLGKRVMERLDAARKLPPNIRQKIGINIGVRHRGRGADQVMEMIGDAAAGRGDWLSLGVSADEVAVLRNFIANDGADALMSATASTKPRPGFPAQSGETEKLTVKTATASG